MQKRATLALVPADVDAVAPILVFAAGGIAGHGLAPALLLGGFRVYWWAGAFGRRQRRWAT
jgi:NAD(P)H-dependent flavin oxidoreductase YrpB (nitropropane dioxygenase family)